MTILRIPRPPHALSECFWLIPALCCVAAVALGLGLTALDRQLADDVPFLFTGGPDGARSLLSAITTSMISFTGLVFSITVVVLQLASSQFSPRVLRTFLRSRTTQVALGVFAATFLYAMMVLRSVRGGDEGDAPFVPQLAVTFAFGLVLASVGLFIQYIHHITQSIRLSTIVRRIGAETRSLIDHRRQDGSDRTTPPPVVAPRPAVICTARSGVLTGVDEAALVDHARRVDCLFALRLRIGDFAPEGLPAIEVHGEDDDIDETAVRAALRLADERTMEHDIAFGFRQLVDIAERALSPGVNDPTTAVQALDEMHDLLRRLAVRPDPASGLMDRDGRVRLVVRERSFGDYLDLALDEILQSGRDALQIGARLSTLLEDLADVARPDHRPVVAAKRQLVQAQVSRRG